MIRDGGEAEARYAVVKLIDGLRDVATPAGPTSPQTHPADRPRPMLSAHAVEKELAR